jgi:hypothetical protein
LNVLPFLPMESAGAPGRVALGEVMEKVQVLQLELVRFSERCVCVI